MQGSSDETNSCDRQTPFVFPAPKQEDELGERCLKGVLKLLEDEDYDYVFYSDSYCRLVGLL